MKESFINGVGIGIGIGAVFVVVRMISDFIRGLFGIGDEES